jgi:hypothetical protein
MAIITTDVEIEKIVAQFWKSRYGEKAANGIELLAPRRGEQFNKILFRHLTNSKPKYTPGNCAETQTIKVRLTHNEITDIRTYKYLTNEGCRLVNSELRAAMNDIFRNFMYAYLHSAYSNGNPVMQQTAILAFIALYDIDMTERNYETLRKNWKRSKEKEILFKENFDDIRRSAMSNHRSVISLRKHFKLPDLSKRSKQLSLFS